MSIKPWDVWIGFDPRDGAAFSVARASLRRFHSHVPVSGLVLSTLRNRGLYLRETEWRLGKLWDTISGAYMSTEFAISRFLVPELVRRATRGNGSYGWALFMDSDVLIRGSLTPLFAGLDDEKAVYCVKHDYKPALDIKMDGQVQTPYPRKNWSSVMAFNVDHPANKALDVALVNELPGRDLHRFCWLEDEQIGALDPKYNYLVGESKIEGDPQIVHFTNGTPDLAAFRDCEYADEWFMELERWAA